ncbi:exodeoxyribonuclease VIII [Lelliottia sp. V89_10]|uniref:exodeoxyribonuclease VIII n=1 Tax=Lelliottia wanjuensis TaxID=3050585 RepID=UPI00249DEA1B|nr:MULTISPECIES: exodeoxyribonuclease VIII [unclassified Lelliottia]MDI3359737.1 exodeoxyribonuclease VIII [Lelliottia sp. V89_13]MDK9548695.1 exodeoxyribonuclease VIII [Lelliottia sp. V89_5]MDK9597327.1 exodeoxyribonuclease VIII [Lelliottia sp. V89_10]
MSVELKVFGGACFPKDKALKKNPELKALAIAVRSINKAAAEAVIFGKLATEHPEWIEDYFKAKVWEDREGLPCPELGTFSSDFFETVAVWVDKPGEPAPFSTEPDNTAGDQSGNAPELKPVRLLDQHSRAARLALFGPVEEITAAQYGQIVDLINDDQSSFEQNLAEALTKETRALALAPERQAQLLAWVREKASPTAQWPDIKKLLAKWIDTPIEKREQATSGQQRTESGATLGGGNPTDRSPDVAHNLQTLGIEVALGILSLYDDIDIYAIPSRFLSPAKGMSEAAADTRYTTWFELLRSTPGILDYSRAAIVALIKSTPESLWLKPVELREHINRALIESDHASPDMNTINTACRAAPRNIPETLNAKTQQIHGDEAEIPAVCPGRAAELNKELHDAFAHNQQPANDQPTIENLGGGVFPVDALIAQQPSNPPQKEELSTVTEDREHFRDNEVIADREIEIAHALNDLISGRTGIMGKEEAESVVICTGHSIADVLPALITDITVTEFCLSPDFSDDEIHNVATDILDAWSDDLNVRQKVALDGIVEYRKPAPPKSNAPAESPIPAPVTIIRTSNDAAPEQLSAPAPTTLTFQQQLTLAALQGLCANPAYCTTSDEIPDMACQMARSIIAEEARYE